MALTIEPIQAGNPAFAGEVSGIDLTQPLSRADADAIDAGMDRYGVLVFHDQDITDAQQIAFSTTLGPLEVKKRPGNIRKASESRLGAGMGDLSNLDKNGRIISADDRQWFFKLGDRLWHSDSSYAVVPAKYSLLSGRVVPSWGGRTEFADMRAAYDALDDRTRAEVEDLICEHSLLYSRGAIGFSEFTPEEIELFRPVLQRLVRIHPSSGRKSLFLSSHAGAIVGWTIPEARSFLRDLTEHATQREFVYSHEWRQHDLVMWDNRSTMHRARRFDRTEVRDMRRTTLAGDAPTVDQIDA
jgi:alpha-ketoglutarate-dependent 2,4-dichlorophenoxyacetate dioxygenase